MSLTSFLDIRDVNDKVKILRPKLSRKIAAPLRVEPRSNRYSMIGTAFDYLLRFELQRRAPHAIAEKWVAEYVPDLLWKKTGTVSIGFDLLRDTADPDYYLPPEEVGKRACAILEDAKAALAAYLKTEPVTAAQIRELAAHAIRLARLDEVSRVLRLDPRFEEVAGEDVEDLLSMMEIVPFHLLLPGNPVLLNPTFKESSRVVGGADADLISGDLLVEFKVTKKGEMNVKDLDQLLGYFLLVRHHRRMNPRFPEIRRVALYFCRHGHLWVLDVTAWTQHPEFPEIEEWFFKRANEGPSMVARRTAIPH